MNNMVAVFCISIDQSSFIITADIHVKIKSNQHKRMSP